MSGAKGWLEGRIPQATVGLVVLHILLCIALFDPKIHTGGDSVTYVLLAESILEAGDGYSLSLEPGPPEAHTLYPPGYPVLLAPLVGLFGRNYVVLKMLSVLFTAGSVLVFCQFARRGREPLLWFCLALAFAVSPGVIDYSRWMLSEAPFLFFTLVALWGLQEDQQQSRIGRPFVLGLLAAVASYYVRSVGAVLLAGASLCYLLQRQWRKFLVHGVAGGALTIPWLVRNRLVTGTTTPYLEVFRLKNVYSPDAGYLDLPGMVGRVFENGWFYLVRELPRALVGSDSAWSGNVLVGCVAVLVAGLALLGLFRALRERPSGADFYVILSCAAILLFQSSVNDVRYLIPLIPLILVYATDGAGAIANRIGRAAWLSPLPVCLATLLTVLALGAHADRIPGNVEMVARYNAGDRYAGYSPGWRNFFEAARWVETNTPADVVVTIRKPRLFNALANRRVKVYPFTTDTDSVLQVVRATDLVLIDAIFPTTGRYLVPALQSEPESFLVVHQTEAPVTWVLSVRDAARSPDP